MSIGRPPRHPERSWQRMVTHVELGAAFQARHIQVLLERAVTLEAGATAAHARGVLDEAGFHHAPVLDDGVVTGYAARERLSSTDPDALVRTTVRAIGEGTVVSADTPIDDLLDLLAEEPFLFVLDRADVTGFVTLTDLNKQPARAYLYLVLAGLEIALADLVRWRYGPDQAPLLDLLGKRDQDAVRSRHSGDREADADADLVSYMGFKHLLRIFEKDRGLRGELGQTSQRAWRSATWPLSELRNDVMHPVSSFVGKGEDAAELARHVTRAEALVDAAVASLRRRYAVAEPPA